MILHINIYNLDLWWCCTDTYTEWHLQPQYRFNCLVPQLPALNLTCDTVGVIQPAVTMATSLQLRDAMKY